MREIVLDTETTGLDPLAGHRVVEVGCIELVNMVATGNTFHAYFNPEMIMPAGAQDIHGLSDEFLADKPLFADKVEEFLEFIGDAQLVIHNAQFDIGFLNAELERVGKPKLDQRLCRHGIGGAPKIPRPARQPRCAVRALQHRQLQPRQARRPARFGASGRGLSRAERRPATRSRPGGGDRRRDGVRSGRCSNLPVRPPRPHAPSAAELAAHVAFLAQISEPLWLKA